MISREEYEKTYIRMMDSVRKEGSVYKGKGRCADVSCGDCPLERLCRNNTALIFSAFAFIDAIEKWGKEHPIITNADKFKEVFGRSPVMFGGEEYICPNLKGCSVYRCAECAKNYWEAEYTAPVHEEEF